MGGLLMFATTIVWGVYTALGKRVAAADALDLTARMAAVGAVLLLPIAALEIATVGLPRITAGAWIAIAYLGAIASGVAYLFYNAALQHVSASEAGVYTNLIPSSACSAPSWCSASRCRPKRWSAGASCSWAYGSRAGGR